MICPDIMFDIRDMHQNICTVYIEHIIKFTLFLCLYITALKTFKCCFFVKPRMLKKGITFQYHVVEKDIFSTD